MIHDLHYDLADRVGELPPDSVRDLFYFTFGWCDSKQVPEFFDAVEYFLTHRCNLTTQEER